MENRCDSNSSLFTLSESDGNLQAPKRQNIPPNFVGQFFSVSVTCEETVKTHLRLFVSVRWWSVPYQLRYF
jgi:hypothetical protein